MSYNKKLLQLITENLNKPSKSKVPRNQWQHPGEITSIPSKNITMRGVTYPVLGVDANGYAQMMQPGEDYAFTQGPVMEYPMMQVGGRAKTDATSQRITVPLTQEEILRNKMLEAARRQQKNQASVGSRGITPSAIRNNLYSQTQRQEFYNNLMKGADVATDIMQLGNFVPHPIGQAIGKVGNMAGAYVDGVQAVGSLGKGDYTEAMINAASVTLPAALSTNSFRRNSKYLRPGQVLYPLSPQAKILPGGYTRVEYIEPFHKVNKMTDRNLIANRGLLGLLGAETVYDTKQSGGPISYKAWKRKYNLRETPDYNLKRAWELGYIPDATGHLPTVDNQTGQFLKAKNHPTLQLEIDWYNSPEGAEFRSRNMIDSSGKFFRYVPRPKMVEGGDPVKPRISLPVPTYNDSLHLYNAQMALNNFYNNEIKAGRISKSIAPNINPLIASKETKKIIKNYDSKKNVNRQEFEKTFDNLKDRNLEFYEKLISSRNKFNRGTYDNAYKNIYNLSPNDISRLEHEGIAKTKSGNDYQQYYRDIITPMQNLAAPFALVDRRIKPQREIEYSPIGVHNNYPGGSVKVYDYDPLAIKPYALRTKQEKIEWEKKYGKAKPQTNKPTPNTTVKQVITSETQEIPQQVIAEPVSVAEPRYQMRGDHSVFGPANSLLGLLDTKTNQFYPDYLNESARARVNQADSDLIANPEALAEYVRRLRDGITIVPKKQIGGWLNKYAEGGDIENPFLIGMGERPRAIKDNTRQVTNPSAEKYSRDAVLKRQFIDAKNFHNGWINSPMHKQMVKRSAGSKAEADIITKNRLSSLNKAQFSYYDHEHRKDPGIAGISNNATGNIALFSPAMNLLPSTMTHELSHSSDKEVDVEYGREIPIDDMNKISDYASKVFQQRQGERDKKGVDWFRYITQPTEVRARLNDIRRTGKEAEIYDPYVEKITPKKLDNLIELLYRQHDDTPGYNPYENLRDVYTNEQILDLLNSVSQNQNVPGNQPQVAARYGGGLYKMQPGGEKKEKGLLEEAWDTVTSWFSDEPAKPARREFPSDYKLKDPRKISATTGKPINPKRDLFSGSYSGNRMAELVTAAKRYGINPLDLLAVDLQETGWGNRSDAGAGHSLLSRSDLIPTKLPSEEEAMLDGADYFARSYKTKMNYADKLGIKDPALRIQVYNGLGKVVPETEQDYHGFKMQSIYGVPIPKGGIDMKKNPLYGKRIMDIRDNILSRDTALLNYIKEYSSGGQRSWLDRYDDGGEAIADVKYDVQRGDTLSKISSKYKVPLATLASANQLENPNLIVQGKQLNIPANPRKELTFEEIPTADNKKIIIDNFSKHYDYIVEKDKVYYKVKGGKTWADISDNKAAQENLFKFLDKNKYWAGYESGEQDLYSGTTTPRPTTIPEIPNMMSTANVPKAPRPNLTQKVDATGVKKPIAVPQVPTLGFSGNTNIPKAPRANLNQVADATFMRQPITGIPSKNQDDLIEQATSYLKSEVSKLNIKSKELQKDLGNTIEDIKHSVKSGVNKGVQTVEDLVETGLNGIKRKYATHTGADDDTVVPTSVNNKPKTVSEYYGNRTGAEITAVIDTPDKSGRQFKQQVLPVSSMKFGKRNRGEYNDITTEGLEVTTFHPFSSDRLPDNTSVIALDPNGKLHTGVYKDFKDKKGFTFSKTFRNNIVDFSETSGKNDYVSGKVSGNPSYNHPKIKVLNDAGKLVDGSLNILVKDDSKKDFYGSIQGGRVLFVNPDTKEQFLVSGSMSHIKDAFKKIKGNSKYLEAYTLDNGTYSRGLSYKDKKLTTDRLKSYDNENTGGGNGLYIVGYDQPVNRFKEELVEGMPNVRTEKDDSYKKGHALKNEIKNIVLHHTAYTSPNAEKEVKKQYMTPNQPSSHIVIERNGKRTVYASPEQVTFHAGESKWNNRSDVNDFSIGVEFQGDTNNQPLTQQQIESFVEYYVPIAKKYNLSLKDIITHEMVAPGRKPDVTQKEYKRILKYMKDNNIK